MDQVAYLITVASIIGTVANSLQKRWCFLIWAITNTFWCIYNIINGSYAQALLYLFNFAMAIVGLWRWGKIKKEKDKETAKEVETLRENKASIERADNDE